MTCWKKRSRSTEKKYWKPNVVHPESLKKVDLSVIKTLKDEKVTTCTEAQELLQKSKELYQVANEVKPGMSKDEPYTAKRGLEIMEPFKLSIKNASSQIVKYC